MRKYLAISALLVLALTLSCMSVNAQSSISLQIGTPGTLTFAAGSSPILMVATTMGSAGGTEGLAGASSYTLTGGPITLTSTGGNTYSAIGALNIEVFSGTTDLLSGTLDFVDFVQHGKTGNSNVGLETNLDITGGSFCAEPGSVCGSGAGFATLTIGFPTGVPVTHGVTGRLFTGTIMPNSPASLTPEPVSMLLFGTGLVVLGGTLRRRQRKALVQI
jgi:hypothetical protein